MMLRLLCTALLLTFCLPVLAPAAVPAAHAAKKGKKAPPPKAECVLTWKVAPDTVVIHVDGKKIGTAAKAPPVKLKPGMHMIRLVWGKDETEEPVELKAGESREFQYTFEDSGKPAPAPAPAPDP